MENRNKVNIILSGGGGKGAFELGTWLVLRDVMYKVPMEIEAYSGSSVGALNAALFACNTAEEARIIWDGIDFKKILTPDIKRLIKIYTSMKFAGLFVNAVCEYAAFSKKLLSNGKKIKISNPLLKVILEDGIFSREGLIKIMNDAHIGENIDLHKVWVCCTDCNSMKPEYRRANAFNYEQLLLASSAIPVVFGKENGYYRDGGIVDNVPIKPLLPGDIAGSTCKKFIVIHLGKGDMKSFKDRNFAGCKIYHIFPEKSLHGFLGTFDFSKDGIKRMRTQALDQAEKEFFNIDTLREMVYDNSDKEVHYCKNQKYDNVKEMYKAIRKLKKRREANEELLDNIGASKGLIVIEDSKLGRFVRRILQLSTWHIGVITGICSTVTGATVISGGTLTPAAMAALAPVGVILGPGLLGSMIGLFIVGKSWNFIKQLRDNYECVGDSGDETIIVSKDYLGKIANEIEKIKMELV